MKALIKIEIRRLTKSISLYIALAVGIILSVSEVIQYAVPAAKANNTMEYKNIYMYMPHSVFTEMIGLGTPDWQSTLFYYILPILAAIPYGYSFYIDKKTGYLKNIFTRTKRSNYFVPKYIITFISGGIVSALPIIINLVGCMMVLPYIQPMEGTNIFDIINPTLWSKLFYSNAILYIFCYCILLFIFGGLLACMCLSAAYIVVNVCLVQIFPVIILYLHQLLLSAVYIPYLLPTATIIRIDQQYELTYTKLFIFLLLLFLFSIPYIVFSRKEECL